MRKCRIFATIQYSPWKYSKTFATPVKTRSRKWLQTQSTFNLQLNPYTLNKGLTNSVKPISITKHAPLQISKSKL